MTGQQASRPGECCSSPPSFSVSLPLVGRWHVRSSWEDGGGPLVVVHCGRWRAAVSRNPPQSEFSTRPGLPSRSLHPVGLPRLCLPRLHRIRHPSRRPRFPPARRILRATLLPRPSPSPRPAAPTRVPVSRSTAQCCPSRALPCPGLPRDSRTGRCAPAQTAALPSPCCPGTTCYYR